jgi:O-antigen/teichoic acid export membrane protein
MFVVPGRAYLAASTFLRLIAGLLVLLILARYMPAEAVGASAIGLAAGAILSTVQDWGQGNVILRDVGRSPEAARRVTSRSVALRMVTTFASLAAALPVMHLVSPATFVNSLIVIVAAGSLAGLAEIVLAPTRALARYASEFCAVFVSGLVYVALVFWAASASQDLFIVAGAMLGSRMIQVVVSLVFSRSYLDLGIIIASIRSVPREMKTNVSLAAEGVLVVVTNQLDTLVLANTLPLASLGVYQAGARFAQSVSPLASILAVSSIPKLAQSVGTASERSVVKKVFLEFSCVGLVALFGFLIGGPIVSEIIYRGKYAELSYLWPSFGVYTMLRLAAAPANVYFIAANLARYAAWLRLMFAAFLVVCLSTITPVWGLRGVGYALSIAAALHLCAAFWLYGKQVGEWVVVVALASVFLVVSAMVLWGMA